jgi:hypothetical protein
MDCAPLLAVEADVVALAGERGNQIGLQGGGLGFSGREVG